jgi:hypothetical protein
MKSPAIAGPGFSGDLSFKDHFLTSFR